MHACISLAHPQDTFYMTNCDWDASDNIRFASNVRIEVCDLITIDLVESRETVTLSIDNVLAEKVLLERLGPSFSLTESVVYEHILFQMLVDLLVLLWLILVFLAKWVTPHV